MNDADVNLTVTALSESEVDAQAFTCEYGTDVSNINILRVDYISSCGFPLMPVMLQVVGFVRGFGCHMGHPRQREG